MEQTMLFFDDFLVQDSKAVERKWFKAEPWPGIEPFMDETIPISFNCPSVWHDSVNKRWLLWATGFLGQPYRGPAKAGIMLYESEDGLHWKPSVQKDNPDKYWAPEYPHLVFSGRYCVDLLNPFFDMLEKNPEERFKSVYSDSLDKYAAKAFRLATSPDGIHWTVHEDRVVREHHIDTFHSISWNPYSEFYQIISRPSLCDRRIALYSTRDFHTFSKPVVVIHPDPVDPTGIEFYGMPHFYYHGYFIGFLWRLHGTHIDNDLPFRIRGRVDAELVYSINGITWNRTDRKSLLLERDWARDGFGSTYPASMLEDENGWIRVYSSSWMGEHYDLVKSDDRSIVSARLTIHRWRKDGFCALEAQTDAGFLLLRPLESNGGVITINAIAGKFGKIRAELRNVEGNSAIPGFELENSIPFSGDDRKWILKWKEKTLTDELRGKRFRLYFEMDQARIYSVKLDCSYHYGEFPQPNLTGDYIAPNIST